MWIARALALTLAAAVASSCRQAPPIDVVVVAIDTLRADHLGCYGYSRPTTPRIDALAAEGVVFEHAISQSPWTLPAFASILTGVIPQRHGAGQGKQCLLRPCGALAPDQATLAERFAGAGYRTGSFVSNGFTGSASGLGRGFEEATTWLSGTLAVDHALAWLEQQQKQERAAPFFLFVHLVEPHLPYAPPADDVAPFLDPTYPGPLGTYVDGSSLPQRPTDADRRRIVDLYDGDVHWADRLAGRVFDAVARLGAGRRTLVAVVADHGEELYDRDRVGHGHTLYDELLHVPLIVRFPDGTPRRRIAQQVRTMDLFPTLLEAAGIAVPPDLDGVSLVGLAHGGAPPPETASALSEFTFVGPELRGLRSAHDKLVRDVDHDETRLFDLDADPGEWTDVANARPERVGALREALAASDASGKPGFYVFVRAGWKAVRMRAVLLAPASGFGEVTLRYANAGDTVTVSPDRRTATATFALGVSTENGVHVEMRDPAEPMTIASVAADDAPLFRVAAVLGAEVTPALRLPVVVTPAQAAVQRATPPEPAPAVVVAVEAVAPRSRATLQLDPATAEHLRALGYAQ